MTVSNLPLWAQNVHVGINPIALHGLIQTATIDKAKKRKVKEQGLHHLPALSCLDRGVVKPALKVGVEHRVHTHGETCIQSIPKEWRPALTVTDPDNRLIYADWKACHLQILAYSSGDTAMIAHFESGLDFYENLPVSKPPMPAEPEAKAKWRKSIKAALNAYLNGGRVPAMTDSKRGIGWKQAEAEAFIQGLESLFDNVWTDAGDMIQAVREATYNCPQYVEHCQLRRMDRSRGKALGIGLMRIEADLLTEVLNDPDFAGVYGGSVVMPMRDGVLVQCPAAQQADLADWMRRRMTLAVTRLDDRADNHAAVHVDVDIHGTSWGQVDGEDVEALVGDAFMDEASDASDNATDIPALLLAAAAYKHDLENRARNANGPGSRALTNNITNAFHVIKEGADFRERKNAPPPTPVDPNLPTLVPKLNRDGEVIGIANSQTNLERVMADPSFLGLWYNDWDHEVYSTVTGEKVDEKTLEHVVALRCEQSFGWDMKLSPSRLNSCVIHVAKQDRRHPLRDAIDALEWDGVPRLDTWLQEAVYGNVITDSNGDLRPDFLPSQFGITLDEYRLTGVYGKNLLLTMMARLYDPGCKADAIVVLAGLQGTGKQKLFKALAGKCDDTGFSYYGGTKREAKTADAALQGLKLWLWEDQEMSGHVGKKGEDVKAFLSNAEDDVRLPYGRSNERIQRHWVPVGSTNDAEKLLEDATGSRRYNCVRIPYYRSRSEEDPIQPRLRDDWVASVRDQLMAEARQRYHAGERWWLERGTDAEYELRAKVNRDMFTRTTPMDSYAQKVFFFNSGGKEVAFTTSRFLREFDPDLSVSQMTGKLEREAAKALKAAGFFQTRRLSNGRKERVWGKELDPGVTPAAERTGFVEANRVHLRPTSDNFADKSSDPGWRT